MTEKKRIEKQKEEQVNWEKEEERLRIEDKERKLMEHNAPKLANAETESNTEIEKTKEQHNGKAERKLVEKSRKVEQVRMQLEEDSAQEAEREVDVEKIEKVLAEETEQLEETEARIKDLEASIFSLDLQLERLEIEKMKQKTDSAKKITSLTGHGPWG